MQTHASHSHTCAHTEASHLSLGIVKKVFLRVTEATLAGESLFWLVCLDQQGGDDYIWGDMGSTVNNIL